MALREMPMGEQPLLPAIELGEVVREIQEIESVKRVANRDWNDDLKFLRKRMFKLANDMKGGE